MTIPVYIICTGNPESSYVAKLTALFDCGYFDIFVVKCEDDIDTNEKEKKAIIYSLTNAKEIYCDSACIIVKDYMFSNLSCNNMYNLIKSIVEDDKCSWDVCYLARYLDKCDGTVVLPDITTGGSLVTSNDAEGDDALMFSPKARDLLISAIDNCNKSASDTINAQINDDKLKGVAISPPVVSYNPVFGDMQKTWECDGKGKPIPPNNDDGCSYTWIPILLLILIIIILMIWFFFYR